jgi:DNA-binding NarL/FixJ family response regulator
VTVIRVLVADDHPFVRATIVDLLDTSGDFTVVAVCQDGDEVVAAALRTSPDVVLLDLQMPRVTGLEAARALLAVRPEARVVLLTGSPSSASAEQARALGVAGYVLKDGAPGELVEHLRTVAAGGTAWGTAVSSA